MGAGESKTQGVSRSVEVADVDPREGFGAVHRNVLSTDKLIDRLDDGVTTLWSAYEIARKKHANRPSLGVRPVAADGQAGEFVFISYQQMFERVDNLAAGLASLGAKKLDKIGIYSINRPEWVLADVACARQGYISVPLYDTLGPQAVEYIIGQAEVEIVVCSANKVQNVVDAAKNCPSLKYIIQMEDVDEANKVEVPEGTSVTVMAMQEVEETGKGAPCDADPSEFDDLATICYTSGTTGNPKGVMLTHHNFCALRAAITLGGVDLNQDDVHISYLPLAHMFERAIMFVMLSRGGTVGFFQGDVLKLFDDIATLRPTIFPSVPRLLNRLYDKVNLAMEQKGGVAKWLFETGMASKKEGLKRGTVVSGFWDGLVFGKIKQKLGGRVRIMITGSAPISADVQDFLQICMSCPVLQGYGLTETCAGSNITHLDNTVSGHVGAPLVCVEQRLMDVPDMEYTSKDEPLPRGEVLFRGPSIFQGYYMNDEKTAESFTDEWFHSGDIGQWNPDGTLAIIDRKKNMFKLAQGEYVAAEKIETVYMKNPNVLQIFIYGDSLQAVLVAVIVPDPDVVKPWCQKNGISTDDWAAACNDERVKAMIMKSCEQTASEEGLRKFERFKDVIVEPTDLATSGLLTPTFKLKRPTAKAHYKEQIDAMYVKYNEKERERTAAREAKAAGNQA